MAFFCSASKQGIELKGRHNANHHANKLRMSLITHRGRDYGKNDHPRMQKNRRKSDTAKVIEYTAPAAVLLCWKTEKPVSIT